MKFITINRNLDYLKNIVNVLPELPGVYQYFDDNGKIIYVGKAKNLKKRVSSYFTLKHENNKTLILVKNIADIKYLIVESEEDALLLENVLIKEHQPRYNIRLKDDKTYPWICVKNEMFPRIIKTRNILHDDSKYFGPYTSFFTISTLLDLFKSIYKIRTCNYKFTNENIISGKYKICLEYHLGNCAGPCESLISEKEYETQIIEIVNILKGNTSFVINQLKQLMNEKSSCFNYEDAYLIKQKIGSLEKYQNRSTIVSSTILDVDVFSIEDIDKKAYVNFLKVVNGAIIQTYNLEINKCLDEGQEDILLMAIIDIRKKFFSDAKEIIVPFKIHSKFSKLNFIVPQRGEKKKLLQLSQRNAKFYRLEKEKQSVLKNPNKNVERILFQLQKDFKLKELPQRIECFDNSNLQGKNPVAACVVFEKAKPLKREYRHYNIKSVEGPNDYASMEEIVYRRYKRILDENLNLPQLVVIDGGKGQLSSAVKSLEKLSIKENITIVGIAKKLEEIYFPNDSVPLYLDKNSESLKVIQQLRDEAHRFGINFHRKKRSDAFINSELEKIRGVGPATIHKLLNKYKSVYRIKQLDIKELEKEVGINRAKLIVNYFDNNQ